LGFNEAPLDAGGDVDAAEGCPATALLCDDFESGGTAAWSMVDRSPNARVIVSNTRAHAGAFALDATVPTAGAAGGYACVNKTFPTQTTGVIAVRQWIYATPPFSFYDEVLGLNQAQEHYIVFGCDHLDRWVASERSPSTGLIDHFSVVTCTTNAWVCVELVYSLSARRATYYIDGSSVLDFTVADPAPQFSLVQVGATRADSAGFHVYVDDVVIADQRIGCQ
jgi:hypothetical protein